MYWKCCFNSHLVKTKHNEARTPRVKVLTGLPVFIHSCKWEPIVHLGLSAKHHKNSRTLSLLEPEWPVRKKEE